MKPGQVYLGWVVTIPNLMFVQRGVIASLSGMGSDDSQRHFACPDLGFKSIWDG